MEFTWRLSSRSVLNFDVLLISSDQDTASLNIRDSCLDLYPFETTELEFQGNPIFKVDAQKRTGLLTVSEELVTLNAEILEKELHRVVRSHKKTKWLW